MNTNKNSKPAKKQNTIFIKKLLKNPLKYLSMLAQVVTAIVSVFVISRTNTLTNTANLVQLYNAIQANTTAFYSVELKKIEMKLAEKNGKTIDTAQTMLLDHESRNVLTSFLNIYDFACQQYISNRIDKEVFKLTYKVMIEEIIEVIMPKYIDDIDDKELYPAIKTVYTEWYGK